MIIQNLIAKNASPFLLIICKRPLEASILSLICLFINNWHSRWLVASIDDTSVVRIVRSCAKPTHTGHVGHSLVSKQTWPIVNSACVRGRNKRPKLYICLFENVKVNHHVVTAELAEAGIVNK